MDDHKVSLYATHRPRHRTKAHRVVASRTHLYAALQNNAMVTMPAAMFDGVARGIQSTDRVTSQDVRLEIERTEKCALHSCIENPGIFCAFNKTYQSDRGFACVDGN
jgi:hypothetical protein